MTPSNKDIKPRTTRFWTYQTARAARLISILAVVIMPLMGCMSAGEQREANLNEDVGACSDFGARYGSRAHTACMMRQQERRDYEPVLNAERARISAETARNNLEMLKIIRERREQRQ